MTLVAVARFHLTQGCDMSNQSEYIEKNRRQLVGNIGEALVLTYYFMHGYHASMGGGGSFYDISYGHKKDGMLYGIQVKTSMCCTIGLNHGYKFKIVNRQGNKSPVPYIFVCISDVGNVRFIFDYEIKNIISRCNSCFKITPKTANEFPIQYKLSKENLNRIKSFKNDIGSDNNFFIINEPTLFDIQPLLVVKPKPIEAA